MRRNYKKELVRLKQDGQRLVYSIRSIAVIGDIALGRPLSEDWYREMRQNMLALYDKAGELQLLLKD